MGRRIRGERKTGDLRTDVVRGTRRNRITIDEFRAVFAAKFPSSGADWLGALATVDHPMPEGHGFLWTDVKGSTLTGARLSRRDPGWETPTGRSLASQGPVRPRRTCRSPLTARRPGCLRRDPRKLGPHCKRSCDQWPAGPINRGVPLTTADPIAAR